MSRHLLRFEAHGLLLGWGFVWCIPGVSARIWFGSGIPPTLSVVGVHSTLSPPLRFSAPVGIRVQPVLQRIISVTTFEQEEIIMSALLTTILYKAFSPRPTRFSTSAPSPRNAHSHERWRCLDCHILSLYHRACLTSPYCSYTRTCIHTGTAITPLTVPCHPHVARWDTWVSLGGKR